MAGGMVGLVLAAWGKDWIVTLAPEDLYHVKDLGLDSHVLGFTLALSLLTGFVFGLFPALHASKQNLSEALKESGSSATGSRQRNRARGLLVVTEIAIGNDLARWRGLDDQELAFAAARQSGIQSAQSAGDDDLLAGCEILGQNQTGSLFSALTVGSFHAARRAVRRRHQSTAHLA